MPTCGDGHRLLRWPWRKRPASAKEGPGGEDVAALLIAECEAYLLGSYVEHLETRAEPIPVWAWTNLLAHGSRADLVRAAKEVHGGRSPARRWRVVRALVAREVLDVVGDGASLLDVQREVLAPLELAIAAHPDAWSWTPQRWLNIVRSALHGTLGTRT